MHPRATWVRTTLLTGLASLGLLGCGGGGGPAANKAVGTVSGTIKHKGQAAPENMLVTFLGGDGVTASGRTDGTGHYSLTFQKSPKIPVGSYKVALTPYNPGDSASADPKQFFDPATGMTRPPQVVKSSLPDKYSNPTTSGITREVNEGANTIDIDLPD